MKIRPLLLSLIASLGLASVASAVPMPTMQVKVMNGAGKTVYEGTTSASGDFATSELAPGNYVVQFNSKSTPKGGPFAITVEAGKAETLASSVSGSKFSTGGVAMKISVATAASLTGNISHAGEKSAAAAAASTTSSTPVPADGIRMENGVKVRYDHGKKYVWVEGGISTLGGHWVSADSREAKAVENAHQ